MKKILATAAMSALLLTGCGQNSDVIVKVNEVPITQAQFNKAFDKAANNPGLASLGIDIKNDKNNFLYLMIKDRVVSELVVKSLIDQELDKRNITVSKDDVDAELKTIIDKIGSKEKFNEILKQNGISAAEFKKDLAEEVKMKKLVNAIEKVSVSDADAQNFYKQNTDKFKYPEKVRASHILVSANEDEIMQTLKVNTENKDLTDAQLKAKAAEEMAAKLKKAETLMAQVKQDPTSFAKVARESSDDVNSAKQGGDLGFFAKQEMVEAFSNKAFSMKPNTISEIVKTPYGYHIIMVTDRMEAGQQPFDKVKDDIKMFLENQKQVKVLDNFIEGLKKNATIEYVNSDYNPTSIQDALKKQNPIQDTEKK